MHVLNHSHRRKVVLSQPSLRESLPYRARENLSNSHAGISYCAHRIDPHHHQSRCHSRSDTYRVANCACQANDRGGLTRAIVKQPGACISCPPASTPRGLPQSIFILYPHQTIIRTLFCDRIWRQTPCKKLVLMGLSSRPGVYATGAFFHHQKGSFAAHHQLRRSFPAQSQTTSAPTVGP